MRLSDAIISTTSTLQLSWISFSLQCVYPRLWIPALSVHLSILCRKKVVLFDFHFIPWVVGIQLTLHFSSIFFFFLVFFFFLLEKFQRLGFE